MTQNNYIKDFKKFFLEDKDEYYIASLMFPLMYISLYKNGYDYVDFIFHNNEYPFKEDDFTQKFGTIDDGKIIISCRSIFYKVFLMPKVKRVYTKMTNRKALNFFKKELVKYTISICEYLKYINMNTHSDSQLDLVYSCIPKRFFK